MISFILGLFVGATVGIFVFGMVTANRRGEDREDK